MNEDLKCRGLQILQERAHEFIDQEVEYWSDECRIFGRDYAEEYETVRTSKTILDQVMFMIMTSDPDDGRRRDVEEMIFNALPHPTIGDEDDEKEILVKPAMSV